MYRPVLTMVVLAAQCTPVCAGLFTPDEITPDRPFPFATQMGNRPSARPIPHSLFKLLINERTEALSSQFPFELRRVDNGVEKTVLTFKGLAKARVESRLARNADLSADEKVGLSADLIRLGRAAEAIALLKQERPTDYRLLANLAMAHAANGEWDAAADQHDGLVLEDPPVGVTGLSKDQLDWLVQLDRTTLRNWFRLRKTSSTPTADTTDYPLFLDTAKRPVRFVNEAGEYEPGKLAAAERAKLPADAIAIVQQMLLWTPDDAMLFWTLAELYAANGQLQDAADAFDQCTARGLTKPKLLMSHRTAVRDSVGRLPRIKITDVPAFDIPSGIIQPSPTPANQGFFDIVSPAQFLVVASIFVIVTAILLRLQVRSWSRRRRF